MMEKKPESNKDFVKKNRAKLDKGKDNNRRK
jgi:hypothetical protein